MNSINLSAKSIYKLKIVTIFLLTISLSSCSLFENFLGPNLKYQHGELLNGKQVFRLSDKSGEFILSKQYGLKKKSNEYIVKKSISPSEKKNKIVEKSITISSAGYLKGKVSILRPKISQYSVWFENAKYFTEMKINTINKSLDITMRSPESQWNGSKQIPFPKGTGVYCFYNQLVECIRATGYFKMTNEAKTGEMSFHIIWDGYPYFQEQYISLPKEIFTKAIFSYDGKTDKKEDRFTLSFGDHVIFYLFNKKGDNSKIIWVAQGLTVIKNKQKESK